MATTENTNQAESKNDHKWERDVDGEWDEVWCATCGVSFRRGRRTECNG